MTAAPAGDIWAEWKTGYRDGLGAALAIGRACATEPDATALDVLILLETLYDSKVIETGNGEALVVVTRLHPPDVTATEPPANT